MRSRDRLAGLSYCAWLAETARKELTIRAGLAAVSQFEHEHGPFSPPAAGSRLEIDHP